MQIGLFQNNFVAPFTGMRSNGQKLRAFSVGKYGKKAGIYIIREDEVIVYVGMSQSCVVEALYRHFYRWTNNPGRRTKFPRVTYVDRMSFNRYDIALLVTEAEDAPKLERGLILSINPRDNRERYQRYLDEISIQNIDKGLQEQENEYDNLTTNNTQDAGADLPF